MGHLGQQDHQSDHTTRHQRHSSRHYAEGAKGERSPDCNHRQNGVRDAVIATVTGEAGNDHDLQSDQNSGASQHEPDGNWRQAFGPGEEQPNDAECSDGKAYPILSGSPVRKCSKRASEQNCCNESHDVLQGRWPPPPQQCGNGGGHDRDANCVGFRGIDERFLDKGMLVMSVVVRLVAFVLMLTLVLEGPAAAVSYNQWGAPAPGSARIHPGSPLLPGYVVAPSAAGIDLSPGPVTLHFFDSKLSFVDHTSYYRPAALIPASTRPGTYRLWATQNGKTVAEYHAYVGALQPTVTPSAWWVRAGERLRFDGEGFLPGETAALLVDGVSTGRTVRVGAGLPYHYDVRGRLPGRHPYPASSALSYVVPETSRGTTKVYEVKGQTSGASVKNWITTAG